jgi:hypothetical protein
LQPSYDTQSNYSFNPEIGEIRSKLTGWRMFLLSSEAWESLEDGIYSKFSDNAPLIILQMGFSFGSNLAMKFAPTGDESERIILNPDLLMELMSKVGWGIFAFTGDLDLGTHFSITIKNCVFCESKNSYPCNFLRGIILGLASKMYRREYMSSTFCSVENGKHECSIEFSSK